MGIPGLIHLPCPRPQGAPILQRIYQTAFHRGWRRGGGGYGPDTLAGAGVGAGVCSGSSRRLGAALTLGVCFGDWDCGGAGGPCPAGRAWRAVTVWRGFSAGAGCSTGMPCSFLGQFLGAASWDSSSQGTLRCGVSLYFPVLGCGAAFLLELSRAHWGTRPLGHRKSPASRSRCQLRRRRLARALRRRTPNSHRVPQHRPHTHVPAKRPNHRRNRTFPGKQATGPQPRRIREN